MGVNKADKYGVQCTAAVHRGECEQGYDRRTVRRAEEKFGGITRCDGPMENYL